MGEGDIWVKPHEIKRHQRLEWCVLGKLSKREVAESLGLSIRQVQRLKKRVKNAGLLGVIHRNRGKAPGNKTKPEILSKVTDLILGAWKGLNPLHVRDKLKEEMGIIMSRETLRQLFVRLGIPRRKHRRKRHFSRRERRPMKGMLLQADGSPHDWFLTGEKCTLLLAVDDADNEAVGGKFVDYETSLNYLSVFKRIVQTKGIFDAAYVDRHACFKPTRPRRIHREDEDGTQVARALSELGITMINAHTPQAKGRIERLNQTFQDRILKEMRLRGIKTKEAGNAFLESEGLAMYNRWFKKTPEKSDSAYRPIPEGINLDEVFCLKLPRVVKNDNTISYDGHIYKIFENAQRASYARAEVEVRIYPEGAMKIYHGGRLLNTAAWRPRVTDWNENGSIFDAKPPRAYRKKVVTQVLA